MKPARRLTSLSIIKTRIQGRAFATLTGLPLREIVIGYTPLDDSGLATISKLPQLETLRLAPSNISDRGIASLAKHPRLRLLDASRTRITDAAVPALLSAPALREVLVRATALSPEGLDKLRQRDGFVVTD